MGKKAAPKMRVLVTANPEVWEQLWRVADVARLISHTLQGTPEMDIRYHLADELKMLDRSIACFHGNEGKLRKYAPPHPYTDEVWKRDNETGMAEFAARHGLGEK